jgi:hypothetical protein
MAAWPTARRDWLPSPGFALRTADYGSVPRDAEPHVAEARRGKTVPTEASDRTVRTRVTIPKPVCPNLAELTARLTEAWVPGHARGSRGVPDTRHSRAILTSIALRWTSEGAGTRAVCWVRGCKPQINHSEAKPAFNTKILVA